MSVTRRKMLAGSAVAANAALLGGATRAPAAPASEGQAPAYYRYRLGAFELTAIYDGIWPRAIDETFVRNVPYADVKSALADAFMAPDTLAIPLTPLLIDTGAKRVLIDTASGGQIAASAGSLGANLAAAGIDPKAVDTILISNFHPDHINGIKTKDNELVFPNAEILVPQAEWAFWLDDGNLKGADTDTLKVYFLNARRIFGDIRKHVTPFAPGREVAPGITAVDAPGHTPGHTAYAIASGSQSMMALCDTTNHPWLFARHPEWQAIVDMDGPLAVATRKRLLDRVGADRMLVQGYHFPFPANGHIIKTATGYDFVPTMWEPSL
jgi:glyoxylase-like metal-dependent hydrolase (beta-lactamase superfamily II)